MSSPLASYRDIICFVYVLVAIVIIFTYSIVTNYLKQQNQLEFVKAGLVQKVEDGQIIWTKP